MPSSLIKYDLVLWTVIFGKSNSHIFAGSMLLWYVNWILKNLSSLFMVDRRKRILVFCVLMLWEFFSSHVISKWGLTPLMVVRNKTVTWFLKEFLKNPIWGSLAYFQPLMYKKDIGITCIYFFPVFEDDDDDTKCSHALSSEYKKKSKVF